MTQNTQSEDIRSTAAAAMAERCPYTSRQLCHLLRRHTKELRSQYISANNRKQQTHVEEWLCDNYYVLEKESKQSIKDILKLSKTGGGQLARIYYVIYRVLSTSMPDMTFHSIKTMLLAMNNVSVLSEGQFAAVPVAVKAALVEIAHTAVQDEDTAQISYAITSISKFASVDMQQIIEQCSSVEKLLVCDPAEVYPRMCDSSRAYYRHLIARIAQRTQSSETQIAQEMLTAAIESKAPPENHIGFGIINHPALLSSRRRRGKLAITLNLIIAAALSLWAAHFAGSLWIAVLCFLPLWEVLRTPIQQLALWGADIDHIPRMDMSKVVDAPKTVVLISTLLPKASDAPAIGKRLEQLYFSNPDPNIYYCILADFKEWDFPADEKDSSQISAAVKVIDKLNSQHGSHFMMFLRERIWNKTQGKYSGWERKRGAITEFIRFIKSESSVSQYTFTGEREVLPDIKYVLALDGDTNLLYESARTLVAAAMHPLCTPVINDDGIVTSGYGILTPRMSTDLTSAKATPFSRVMSGCGGVTAYETSDKDFYQDLFGESIFAGKGLIDVEAFHKLLDSRFPENQVLSHDIIEGAYLRCGFVSGVEMTDNTPASLTGWLARLHRWLRGDWQNIIFTASSYTVDGKQWENPISTLSKYKLFDNLRRSLIPVMAVLCSVAALGVTSPKAQIVLALAAVLSITFSSLWAALWSLRSGGLFTMSRKFFTRTLPHTFELLAQAVILLIMTPAQAFMTLDAILRSLWRTFVSHRFMLEWTTAAQSDQRKVKLSALLRRFWLAELFGIAYFIAAPASILSLIGLCYALILPVAYLTSLPTQEKESSLLATDRDKLLSYNAAMWRYYEDYVTEENNFLPPDNMQQSPVYRVANRTSPTNIGLYMLSALAARDFDFIDSAGLYQRIDRTVTTIEKLEKWHGNLINWYDTITLETLKPRFVSAVDSGNFVAFLVALTEGLREFVAENREFGPLIRRVEAIINDTDLTPLYNKRRNLFSIGFDMEAAKLIDSHYDFFMSEARLTSYYAVAKKSVGKKHWGSMARTMSRSGSFAGPVSWTGTMFEYFMPHLLLPAYDGSLLGEALAYCLYCHKRRAKDAGVPWGISESAFYAFDNNLNYQYKAHGVQKLGVKRYLDKELIISPYSTFITLPFNPNSGMRNLHRLHKMGVYGRYGFYEAVDFTPDRVAPASLAITRSYMAHHIGMSMVASCNALMDNIMQKRFMHNNHMRSAKEFLQEKIAKSTVVYDTLGGGQSPREKDERLGRAPEQNGESTPLAPRCVLLTNGELTDILTDSGASYLKFGGTDLTRRETDLLRRAQGVFTIVHMGGESVCATKAPFYDSAVNYTTQYEEQSVTYFANKPNIELGVRCLIHPTISCQQRQIAVKNTSRTKQMAQVLCYLEPVLSSWADYSAHPAYSKLFVTSRYDKSSNTLTFSRRGKDSRTNMFLTVGLLEEIPFAFETRREAIMSAPNGLHDLLSFHKHPFSNAESGVPDACCALRFELPIASGEQGTATLLISAARSEAEGIQNIISMRMHGLLEPKHAAKSPLLSDTLEARLGATALGQLLFVTADSAENRIEKQRNKLGQNSLWCTSISGDLPIALVDMTMQDAGTSLEGYLRLHTSLRGIGIEFDLVVLYSGESQYTQAEKLSQLHSGNLIIGHRGGVFLLDKTSLANETLTLLKAAARHIAGSPPKATTAYSPVNILKMNPAPMPAETDHNTFGGSFADGRFYVDKSAINALPWSHVIANSQFGTLVSDIGPGFTWAINSRENKLTPWYNDITTDNTGELCIMKDGESFYNLTHGARASFAPHDAVYDGMNNDIMSRVKITVSGKGAAKYIDISLLNRTSSKKQIDCAYYIEPVLHVNRETARFITTTELCEESFTTLAMHNAYNTAVKGWSVLAAEGENIRRMVDRSAFLCGQWSHCEILPNNDPCAALIVPLEIPPHGEAKIRFILSWGKTMDSAVYMATKPLPKTSTRKNSIKLTTPDKALNAFINEFAPYQIESSRLYGRTAFYQCGGAYGFRDQLQDICAYGLLEPTAAQRQILRCCAVQFEQGDVLHWWHNLPKSGGGLCGVRTRFSDDLVWLPYAVSVHVERTGDKDILSIPVRYLDAPELAHGEQERYISPSHSAVSEDVFSHCVRALDKAYNVDEKGLPRIGCGDWNDGFSSVGTKGYGTSVWLALFMSLVLTRFAKVCSLRGESELKAQCIQRSQALRTAVDNHAWDGSWYLRAFFDDGKAMGAKGNSECEIDLLPQSFAVLADMPDRQRIDCALQNAVDRLVDRDMRIVRLFTPAFQHSHQNPGYVKAYPSGIRENGGQYTHSAVWFAMALIKWGRVEEGWNILSMLNPADRTAQSAQLASRYKLEPYYMAADIYTNPSAVGHGGWSLYTGAVSWYYQAIMELIAGITVEKNHLTLNPRLPDHWPSVSISGEINGTRIDVTISRELPKGLYCDGKPADNIPLDGGAYSAQYGLESKINHK